MLWKELEAMACARRKDTLRETMAVEKLKMVAQRLASAGTFIG